MFRACWSRACARWRPWYCAAGCTSITGSRSLAGRTYPTDRSFVLVANHASHLDTLCLLAALPIGRLNHAFPAAAEDYFCVNALRSLLAKVIVNALPFDRHVAPWRSLSVCARLLEEPGNILILFPEGTRSSGLEPGEFKPGVALLAASRDIPVVPCHIAGTHAALPKGAWCPRPNALRLTIGAARLHAPTGHEGVGATNLPRAARGGDRARTRTTGTETWRTLRPERSSRIARPQTMRFP